MSKPVQPPRPIAPANRDAARHEPREDLLAWLAGFAELFVWLLLLKSYFLQLYIIPTGSMAETLAGEHAVYTCQNCGKEYQAGFNNPAGPDLLDCPNCHHQVPTANFGSGIRLHSRAGDRIVVHGWNYGFGGSLGPRPWDVVVFKNPNEPNVNYIKRLIGLPGEKIEIIDGDVWVQGRDDRDNHDKSKLLIARKTRPAQEALWMSVYEHDFIPRLSSKDLATPSALHQYEKLSLTKTANDWRFWTTYHPRWAPLGSATGWKDLGTRVLRFDGLTAGREELQFATSEDPSAPGMIADWLGYNAYEARPISANGTRGFVRNPHAVTDVRLSADVRILGGDGTVELSVSKYFDKFYAQLRADGRLTLEHVDQDGARETWGEHRVALGDRPHRLSIGHADYQVIVELDHMQILFSPYDAYTKQITAQIARDRAMMQERGAANFPSIRIAAAGVQATLSHVRIDRDGHYTGDVSGNGPMHPQHQVAMGNGVMNSSITLRDDAYFVCGDNSTNSLDARCWKKPPDAELEKEIARAEAKGDTNLARVLLQGHLGPQLRQRYEENKYDIGTVAADQMLGRAFLVYWPGFMPEVRPLGFNMLPDFGHVRWIH